MPVSTPPKAERTRPKPASRPAPGHPGFGIYVHWPFCAAKCPYCDFNSHVRRQLDEAVWREGLLTELRNLAGRIERESVSSIFFGGGTPSLMAPQTVAAVIDEAAGLFDLDADIEITLEANPSSVEAERFKGYRSAGVNRLSLGVQALNEEALRFLGRLHDVGEARAALEIACNTVDRVSADLIYGRPDQTAEQWAEELDEALDFGLTHLSLYQLTIEPGTPFAALHDKGAIVLPPEEILAELYELTEHRCAERGLFAYEVSNYAAPDAECRHNLLYWRYGNYLGIGPGAHGRLAIDGRKVATQTLLAPETWLEAVRTAGTGIAEEQELTRLEQGEEYLLMGLRLSEGISARRYESLAGTAIDPERANQLISAGLLTRDGDCLRATPQGRLVLNSLLAELLA